MVFIADDLAAWLTALLADAGRKKLTSVLLGTEQERALRSAATAAVQQTARELRPSDNEQAEHVALVISQVYGEAVHDASLLEYPTMLESLQAGIAAQLAILDDASLTGAARSSADLLAVPSPVLADKLTSHLLREIIVRGSRGGPLEPLAAQLNHDLTHLQGRQIHEAVRQLGTDSADRTNTPGRFELVLERLGSDRPAIRAGAVLSLAEIAATLPEERARVAQVLSTQLRNEAPGPGPDGDGTYLLPPLQVRLPVAQAIATALASGHFSGPDLSHSDLCRANLANQDLRYADLRRTNFRCADLTRADLRDADLRGANLTGAKIAGALLAGAKLMDAYLAEMDLTEVDLSEVVLVRVDMSRSKLAGVDLSGRDDIYYAKFRYADLTGANLRGTELRGAQFDGAKLHNADLTQARMVKASLEGAELDGTRMVWADLAKADLTRAWLTDTDLRRAMLEEADLTEAHLTRTDLRGAWLRNANLVRIARMQDVKINDRTREDGKLRYRSPSEVRMDDNPDDDPLTSAQ